MIIYPDGMCVSQTLWQSIAPTADVDLVDMQDEKLGDSYIQNFMASHPKVDEPYSVWSKQVHDRLISVLLSSYMRFCSGLIFF